ncbi:MAG: AzlD domain-containing protein [Clostridia bacterium]|jgi:branched-subunit amino acid transport protein|nr:AzlD domain-containing protein [Clostridia bacterium]
MTLDKILLAVLLMAVVTYLPRVFPLVAFQGKLQSRFLRSFLYYVPFAVLGAMTFPQILYSTGNIYSSAAGTIMALILAYFEQGLLKVALGAIFMVYLYQLWF